MRGAIDTLIGTGSDGTLIVRQANFHQAATRHFSGPPISLRRGRPIHCATCTCGWMGADRARARTAERDAAKHEEGAEPQTVWVRSRVPSPEIGAVG